MEKPTALAERDGEMAASEANAPAEAEAAAPPPADPANEPVHVRDRIVAVLKTVYDPEIPVNIWELGLIYDVIVRSDGHAQINMTLTTPNCPAAELLPPEVETKARSVQGVSDVQLDIVWNPPWTPEYMSEAAKLELGMM